MKCVDVRFDIPYCVVDVIVWCNLLFFTCKVVLFHECRVFFPGSGFVPVAFAVDTEKLTTHVVALLGWV